MLFLGKENSAKPMNDEDPDLEISDEKEVREILHHLKIFAQVKENEKLATQMGVGVHKPSEPLLWFRRMYSGDSRDKNLSFIETTFNKAFALVNGALQRRESLVLGSDSHPKETREHMISKLRNGQRIARLSRSIGVARERLFSKLRSTYEDDPTITSRIDILAENIDDQLKEVEASMAFLDQCQTQKETALSQNPNPKEDPFKDKEAAAARKRNARD